MLYRVIFFILFANSVLSRHVPRFSELDEEDQHLLRAAYDTPSYDNDEYQVDDDLSLGKLDLLKDGLWALKAKMKELKAFNKAMVANLLSTKLKMKELVANSMITLKKHHHMEPDKIKPNYNYQAPSSPQYSQQQYSQQPQYSPQAQFSPQPQYGGGAEYAEPPQYALPQHTHDPYYGH